MSRIPKSVTSAMEIWIHLEMGGVHQEGKGGEFGPAYGE